MQVLTADEIRAVEVREDEIGTKFLRLMEKAGTGCARVLMEQYSPEEGSVAVLCGKGKNGGDGFVIARKLRENDYDVTCILAFGEPAAADAIENYERAKEAGVPMVDFGPDLAFAEQAVASAAVLVDCMFGIGFHGAASEEQAEVFDLINRSPGVVFAVDVPSGVDTDTGAVNGEAVSADMTLAITCLKPAHVLYPAKEYCGQVQILDIDLLPESFEGVTPRIFVLSDTDAAALMPMRPRTAHKNDFGHLLSVCGSVRMPGAAGLCANAAVRTGAGLVTAAFPRSAYPSLAAHLTEAMLLPLPETADGKLSPEGLPLLRTYLRKATAVVCGCGLGTGSGPAAVVDDLIRGSKVPVLLDADALNLVAEDPDVLKESRAPLVLTPHPGEFARLTGMTAKDIQADRIAAARDFAERYDVTLLLKGPDTVIAAAGKPAVCINTTGNQALAKGGSGDTLSGIVGSFLAQGMDPFDAACLGAFLHGKCAESAVGYGEFSVASVTATDLIAQLPYVMATEQQDIFEAIF